MTVPLLLVRHGKAGDRHRWAGRDELRPLDKVGRRQAAGLVDVLAQFPTERIVSSWYLRCLESVVNLACVRRLPVEVEAALAEGSPPASILALARSRAGTVSVLCTHGDMIGHLLSGIEQEDGLDIGDDPPMAKGSTWVLDAEGDHFVAARYLPPPR